MVYENHMWRGRAFSIAIVTLLVFLVFMGGSEAMDSVYPSDYTNQTLSKLKPSTLSAYTPINRDTLFLLVSNPKSKYMKTIESPISKYPEFHNKKITQFSIISDDITSPAVPNNLSVKVNSLHGVTAMWNKSEDPESGIEYYAYAIGTNILSYSEAGNIKWWQSVGNTTRATANLNLEEGKTYYVSVYATNSAGLSSDFVSVAFIPHWEELGNKDNKIEVKYADSGYDKDGVTQIGGWSGENISRFDHFLARMLPILKEIYGPPSHNLTVTLVRDLYYSSSNIYFPQYDEIHMDNEFNPQLLTHEFVHAFRDDSLLSSDSAWSYNAKLSGFEEGFAQAVSYEAMNKYIEKYPDDIYINTRVIWLSDYDWDYDFQNVPELRTEDFWSTGNSDAIGIAWVRYEMAAAAMKKLEIENPGFYKKFNEKYYIRLNENHSLVSSKSLIVDIIKSIIPTVEGIETSKWIDQQNIFDCNIHEGKKIWYRTQHYPYWRDYWIFTRLNYYRTFSGGSDWAYWNGTSWVYYNLNGAIGTGTVYYNNGTIRWQKDLQITPVQNPPELFTIGDEVVDFTTSDTNWPWPGNDTGKGSDPANFIFNMSEFGLYRFEVTFEDTHNEAYRVIGNELRNNYGIYGGIKNSKKGRIYMDHEGYPSEPPLNVTESAFVGNRLWAGIHNNRTGYADSVPGKVYVTYNDENGSVFVAQRNIDYGSSSGNQLFLFDTSLMKKVQPPIANFTYSPATPIVNEMINFNASGSFDPDGNITKYEWDFGDGNIINTTVNMTSHLYSSAGDYIVALTVTDDDRAKNLTSKEITVHILPDTIPPASITNLRTANYAYNHINWTWTDPADPDFSRVMIYLDGSFRINITKGVKYYNATGLTAGSTHTIATRTVDTGGNINSTWVNHSATTLSSGEIRGDVNRNGIRDTGDATLILRYVVELPTPSEYLPILPIGDMNCNDMIDTGDATLILRDVVGLPIKTCWE